MSKDEFIMFCTRQVVNRCNHWLVCGPTTMDDVSTVLYALCDNQHFGIFVNEQTDDLYLISYTDGGDIIKICHDCMEYSAVI